MAKKVQKPVTQGKVVIDLALAKKVNSLVSQGLSNGMGDRKPGKMCVEAVVAYAIGDEEHHDQPRCVRTWLIQEKIELNDEDNWTTNKRRGLGMRRLAIAQLGSAYVKCDHQVFRKHVMQLMLDIFKKAASDWIAKIKLSKDILNTMDYLTSIDFPVHESISSTDSRDVQSFLQTVYRCGEEEALARTCELYVQALILMKIPGTKFLHLAPVPDFKKHFKK